MDGITALSSILLLCGKQQFVQNGSFTHFLVIKCIDRLSDKYFKPNQLFYIAKAFHLFSEMAIHVFTCGGLFSRTLKISIKMQNNSSIYYTFTYIINLNITGVISQPKLLLSTKEELQKNLKDQNIKEVRSITIHWS